MLERTSRISPVVFSPNQISPSSICYICCANYALNILLDIAVNANDKVCNCRPPMYTLSLSANAFIQLLIMSPVKSEHQHHNTASTKTFFCHCSMNLQLVSQDIHHTVAIFSQVFQGIYHLSLSHSMELPEKLATGGAGVKPASQTTAQSEKRFNCNFEV